MQRVLIFLVAFLAIVACNGVPGADDAPDFSRNEGIRRVSDAPQAEWQVVVDEVMDSLTWPVVMRGNTNMVSLIRRNPDRVTILGLGWRGKVFADRPFRIAPEVQWPLRRSMARPVDLVDFDSVGALWVLDGDSSRVVAEGVGGYQGTIGVFRDSVAIASGDENVVTESRGGCRVDPGKLVLLSSADSSLLIEVDVRTFAEIRRMSAGAIDSSMQHNAGALRFAGSSIGPCVLWSPQGTVFAAWQRGAWQRVPRIKDETSETTARAVADSSRGTDILSATSFPGVLVFLAGAKGEVQGRLLDIYRPNGTYAETLRLPEPAMLIAGAGQRLILLSTKDNKWFLTSMVLPSRYRARRVEDIPDAVVTTGVPFDSSSSKPHN